MSHHRPEPAQREATQRTREDALEHQRDDVHRVHLGDQPRRRHSAVAFDRQPAQQRPVNLLPVHSILTGMIDAYFCRGNLLMSKRQTYVAKHTRGCVYLAKWQGYMANDFFKSFLELF